MQQAQSKTQSANPASRDPWQDLFGGNGTRARLHWCRVPKSIAPLALIFERLDFFVLQHIVFATVGGVPPVEFASITQQKLADANNASVNGVAKALDILEASGAITSRKVGRHMQYRPNIEIWHQIEKRIVPERYLTDSNNEPEVLAPRSPLIVLPGQKKARPLEEVCQCQRLSMFWSAESHDHTCELGKALAETHTPECGHSNSDPVAVPQQPIEQNQPVATEKPTLNVGFLTLDGASGQIGFEDFYGAIFQVAGARIGEPVPLEMAGKWFDRLVSAAIPLNVFLARLDRRKEDMRKWSFVRVIVDDVVRANEALADRRKAKETPAAAADRDPFPPAMIHENLLTWSEQLRAAGFPSIAAQLEKLAADAEQYVGLEGWDRLEARLIELRSELVNLILYDDRVRRTVEARVAKELDKSPMVGTNRENLRRQLTENEALDHLGLPKLGTYYMSETKVA